jgi:hypothetical protein
MKKLKPPVPTSMGIARWDKRHADKTLTASSERPRAMDYFGGAAIERQPTLPLDTTSSSKNEVAAVVTAVVNESLVEVENEFDANSGSSSAALPVVTAITTEVRVKKKRKNNKVDTTFEDYKNKKKLPPHRLQKHVPKGDEDTDEARDEVNSSLHWQERGLSDGTIDNYQRQWEK